MNAAASVRDRTCSFIKMLLTWFLTVNRLSSSALAISAFERPFASSSAISASRGVSVSSAEVGTIRAERQDLGHLGRERAPTGGSAAHGFGEALGVDRFHEVAVGARPDHLANPLQLGEAAQRQQTRSSGARRADVE